MKVIKYKTMQNEDKLPILVRENTKNHSGDNNFNSPKSIYDLMTEVYQIDKQTEEYMYLLCFDNKCKLKAVFEVSHGTKNGTLCKPADVFTKALLCGASQIIITHNHTSGNTEPSREDVGMTERMKKAGELLGIELADHIIIGDDYFSFLENEMI